MPPVPYATYEDAAARYGGAQLVDLTPTPADYDPESPGSFDPEDFWERMLLAASVELDAHFSRAGYSTPIVESDGATVIEDAAPILREYAVLMALDLAQVHTQDESSPIRAAITRMKDSLLRYLRGDIRLPGANLSDKALAASLTTAAESRARFGDPFRDLSQVIRATRNVPG